MFRTSLACLTLVAVSTLVTNTLAAPDVAGTKTIVISLATGDNGQIIPIVIDKNAPSSSLSQVDSDSTIDDESNSVIGDQDYSSVASDDLLASNDASLDEPSIPSAEPPLDISVSAEMTTTSVGGDSGYDSDTDNEDNKSPTANTTGENGASSNVDPESQSTAAANTALGALHLAVISACIYTASAKRPLF